MFTGITPAGGLSLRSVSPYNAHSPAAEHPRLEQQNYDQFLCSPAPQGEEGRVRSLTAGISRQIRVRPTRRELSALQQQVGSGAYRPDAGVIASRMLLMDPGEG